MLKLFAGVGVVGTTVAIAASLPYVKDTFFHVPKIVRPSVNVHVGKPLQCIGNPIAFAQGWEPHKSYECDSFDTQLVTLVQQSTPTNDEREATVYLCDRHIRDAEFHHQWFAETYPLLWQQNVFPMNSPRQRSYFHNQNPRDFRRSVPALK
jgi:hypothetical protein